MIPSLFLLLGFVLLVAGADLLVKGASSLAMKMRISSLVIGMTIVAFGTSMPEVVVNMMAAGERAGGIVFGNVTGSNIMNTILILGVAGLIMPIAVKRSTVLLEIPVMTVTIFLLMFLVNDQFRGGDADLLSRADAGILLAVFCACMYYASRIAKSGFEEEAEIRLYPALLTALFIILGCAGLIGGGRIIVVNAVDLASRLGVSERLIGLTIVAIGTSLPELATTAVAAYRKKFDIAVGNVVGSNLFNILLVLGLSGMVHPVDYDPAMNVDLLVLVGGSLALFGFMFSGKRFKLDRWEAALFLVGYAAYVIFLIRRG